MVQENSVNNLAKVREKVVLTQIGLTLALILVGFSSCNNSAAIKNLSSRRITNVQLSDGTAIVVQQKEGNHRENIVIKNFVKQWVTLMYGWSGVVPGTEKQDRGVQTTSGGVVPVNSWLASLMMEPSFADGFLNELSEIVKNQGVMDGWLASTVKFRYISEPRQIAPGLWEVDLIADQILFDNRHNRQRPSISYNKTFRILAIPIPTSPLGEDANVLEKTLFKMQASGLEIQVIDNFNS